MNRVDLIGNLTKDPELRTTGSGISVCSFTVAVNRPRAKDGTQSADFISVQTWRIIAENCAKYLQKGSKVGVTGSIHTRSYENTEGRRVYVTEVVADSVEFLSRSAGNRDTGAVDADAYAQDEFMEVADDQLPW